MNIEDMKPDEEHGRSEIRFENADGKLHRLGGLPALQQNRNGVICKEWWVNGKRFREGDLPALEYSDGFKAWYNKNGEEHREGGLPAVIHPDGGEEYWVNGKPFRPGGLPAVIFPDGSKEYWVNGSFIRED